MTTGPLIEFSVNGQSMGSVIGVTSSQPYRARLSATVTARDPLERIEFIQNGEVIESQEAEQNVLRLRMEKEVELGRSSWFAVRVTGRPTRGMPDDGVPRTHSAAIYVEVDGKGTLVKEDLELMLRWVDRLWLDLEARDNFGPGDNRGRAKEMIDQAREHFRQKLADAS